MPHLPAATVYIFSNVNHTQKIHSYQIVLYHEFSGIIKKDCYTGLSNLS